MNCCICNKENAKCFKGNYYCKKHYNHMYRYGKIIKKTIYDKNDYIFEDDIVKIILRDKYQNENGICIIDKQYYDKIKDFKWYKKTNTSKGEYCVTKGINKNSGVAIQDVILDNLDDKHKPIVKYDHINNNGLINTIDNLRIVSHQQNAFNMKKKSTNTSGVTGVAIYTKDSTLKWSANICYNYKTIFIGRSESFDSTVKMRITREAEYFGIHSNNYNPHTNTLQLTYNSHDDNKQTFIECNLQGEIIKFEKFSQ